MLRITLSDSGTTSAILAEMELSELPHQTIRIGETAV
jgi:hypothetical protein